MKSQVTVTDVSQVKKDLTIEVPALEVKAEIERAFDSIQRHAQIPGFRPGRVPRDMVKVRFAGQAKEEAIKQLLPHALSLAIVDHQIKAIGEPNIKDVTIDNENVLRFTATVEVLPEFELKEYKGLPATKRVRRVEDKDVDAFIQRYREASAKMADVEDRPSQAGDHVTVNLEGKYVNPVEAHEHEPLKSDGVTLELQAEGVQAEFNENLTGVRAGDLRMFRVNYPENFTSEGLRGKAIDFTATVVNVQQKQIPELNDEFAQLVSEYQTLDELTATVRKNFAEMNEHQAEQMMREDLVETILEDYDFPVPPSLVEQQTASRLRQFANMLMQRGIPREYLNEINWKERSAEARAMSIRDIRAALVIGRIGAAENIQVTPEEINEEIAAMAEENGISVNEMRATLTKNGGISSIESRLSYDKALDLVVANAQITVEEVTAEQLAQEAAQAGNGQVAVSETDAPTTQE